MPAGAKVALLVETKRREAVAVERVACLASQMRCLEG